MMGRTLAQGGGKLPGEFGELEISRAGDGLVWSVGRKGPAVKR